jgi:hypothetical protein
MELRGLEGGIECGKGKEERKKCPFGGGAIEKFRRCKLVVQVGV